MDVSGFDLWMENWWQNHIANEGVLSKLEKGIGKEKPAIYPLEKCKKGMGAEKLKIYPKWNVNKGIGTEKTENIPKMELEQELRACQEYIGFAEMARNKTEQMMTHDEYVRLLDGQFCSASKELKKWMEEDFETNNDHPETRNIKATQGRFVRSKSEAIIDKLLYSYGIPFRYEQKLVLGNTTIHPDFTIRHPRNGKIYYWEHMGMMDNPDYITNACNKIKLYCRNGIVPSVNLILTYETKESPLDIETIEQMIKEYFV